MAMYVYGESTIKMGFGREEVVVVRTDQECGSVDDFVNAAVKIIILNRGQKFFVLLGYF